MVINYLVAITFYIDCLLYVSNRTVKALDFRK